MMEAWQDPENPERFCRQYTLGLSEIRKNEPIPLDDLAH
jgi:hypothetical protein